MTERFDLLGAVVAYVIFVSSILTFVLRLTVSVDAGSWTGIPLLLMAFPLCYLLIRAVTDDRPFLYYLQVGLMLTWIIGLFLIDYVFKYEFRSTQWMVIVFVMFYFAGRGGMIGVAPQAGQAWGVGAIALFLITAVLAFVQRAVTGL